MKLEIIKQAPPLWKFAEHRLPPSLRAVRKNIEYGGVYAIAAKNRGLMSIFESSVAIITDDTIEIFAPQYYSDFEDLVRDFEAKYKTQIRIKVWESADPRAPIEKDYVC